MAPRINLVPGKCCQGKDDIHLFVESVDPLDAWIGMEVTVKFNEGERKATVVEKASLANSANRYSLEFCEPTTCGCLGGPQCIVGPTPPQEIAAEGEDDCGCGTTACTPLVCAAVDPVPDGYASALDVTDIDNAALATVGDTIEVSLGGDLVQFGEVLAVTGDVITIGFTGAIVSCTSGQGICSLTVHKTPDAALLCYELDLKADATICAWTDGELTIDALVPVEVSYENMAQTLSSAAGEFVWVASSTGVQYTGTGTPGAMTLADGSTIDPVACAAEDCPPE